MEAIGQRLKEILEEKGVTMYRISKEVGVSKSTLTNYITGRTKPDSIKLAAICDFLGVNKVWLLTGIGERWVSASTVQVVNEVREALAEYRRTEPELTYEAKLASQVLIKNVPLVNQYAYAGYLSGYTNQTYMDELPAVPFIVDHEAQGNYVAFEVRGDSMNDGTEDSYLEGDRLLCREIQRHLWEQSRLHIRKWDFVIVHKDGILIKRIIDHNTQTHELTIHSLNPLYDDRILRMDEIRQIFNVIEIQRTKRR